MQRIALLQGVALFGQFGLKPAPGVTNDPRGTRRLQKWKKLGTQKEAQKKARIGHP